MSREIDVRIEHLVKEYRAGTRRRSPRFRALDDVNIEVPRGRALGIIGRNGAGKSTLLKILAGITAPTEGRVVISGHLAALIEIGSGFHPELTGRENVFLSGAILGMSRRDITEKLPSIVDFAGVGPFIDTPVKWYSSGMYVRLGFAVTAHLDPDILLIDEVLAVGDAEFQVKCLQRVQELKRRGVTILLISHDLTAVEQLCDDAVLLEKGRVVSSGPAADVIASYHRSITTAAVQAPEFSELAREGALKLTGLGIATPGEHIRTGDPLLLSLRFDATRSVQAQFELSYYSADGRTVVATATTPDGSDAVEVHAPGGEIEFLCQTLPFPPGTYYVGAVVREAASGHVMDWWDGGTRLHVDIGTPVRGQFLVPHRWSLRERQTVVRAR